MATFRISVPITLILRFRCDYRPSSNRIRSSNHGLKSQLKYLIVVGVASAVLFPSRILIAQVPPTIVSESNILVDSEGGDKEKFVEKKLVSNPSSLDFNVLKNSMELMIIRNKIPEAIEILDMLIKIKPREIEWPMKKAHLYAYSGDFELAKEGFNEVLKKDPFHVEAFHGLLTVALQEKSNEDLMIIEKRV